MIQGAFTLWNMQADESVLISANLAGLSAGRIGAPVFGSGIFVSGAGDKGGRLIASRLETGAVYSNAKIPPGTPNQISGGVFTVYGARVDVVCNRGPVMTYGVNDMVLDNWGFVDRWIAEDKLSSFGPSGIGFVNFGIVNELKVQAPIETFGQGARGFNVYAGTVHLAEFDRIVTHADGAVGIQISQPIGRLVVHRGIETFGGTGESLVKGVVMKLSATGLSVKTGGSAREIEIDGGIITNGTGIAPIELNGAIQSLRVNGGLAAAGGVSIRSERQIGSFTEWINTTLQTGMPGLIGVSNVSTGIRVLACYSLSSRRNMATGNVSIAAFTAFRRYYDGSGLRGNSSSLIS